MYPTLEFGRYPDDQIRKRKLASSTGSGDKAQRLVVTCVALLSDLRVVLSNGSFNDERLNSHWVITGQVSVRHDLLSRSMYLPRFCILRDLFVKIPRLLGNFDVRSARSSYYSSVEAEANMSPSWGYKGMMRLSQSAALSQRCNSRRHSFSLLLLHTYVRCARSARIR